uniref:Uncharacterized protein n=1 Tax=Cacopsylla melanoneura TaxID=428564 RepID=A0A8D8VT95_9HEMI
MSQALSLSLAKLIVTWYCYHYKQQTSRMLNNIHMKFFNEKKKTQPGFYIAFLSYFRTKDSDPVPGRTKESILSYSERKIATLSREELKNLFYIAFLSYFRTKDSDPVPGRTKESILYCIPVIFQNER